MVSVYVNDVSGNPSHTTTGLENGTSYDFSVFGINMLGAGPSLDASATPSTVPDAPEVSFGHSDQTILLSWFDPYDEGSAITGNNIYRTQDSYNYTNIASVDQTILSYSDTDLTNGLGYFYVIAAVNANGEGPRSGFGGEYPSTVPNAPSNIIVSNSNASGSGEQLTVSWTQSPTDQSGNGGSAN